MNRHFVTNCFLLRTACRRQNLSPNVSLIRRQECLPQFSLLCNHQRLEICGNRCFGVHSRAAQAELLFVVNPCCLISEVRMHSQLT